MRVKLKVDSILYSPFFGILMLLVNLTDTIIIMAAILMSNEETKSRLDMISKIFLLFYLFEIALKMIIIGFRRVFQDNWNK